MVAPVTTLHSQPLRDHSFQLGSGAQVSRTEIFNVIYIWEPVSPGLPEYHRGLLGRSIQRFRYAFQEVHRPGRVLWKEPVSPGFLTGTRETGGPNGENWRAQWLSHRLDFFLLSWWTARPAGNGERRWKGRQKSHKPTTWLVVRVKSVLCFLFA